MSETSTRPPLAVMREPIKAKPPGVISYTLAILGGAPIVGIGLFLTFSVIGIPVGIPLMIAGSLPYYYVDRRRLAWRLHERYASRPLENDEPAPWL